MRIHKIIPKTRANGPGVRFGIWVQGCSLRCKGCINPETHNPKSGDDIAISELLSQIQIEFPFINGVSISGGEPLDQPEELLELVKTIKTKYELPIILWTGYQSNELEFIDLYSEICKYIDVSIIGRYLDQFRNIKGLKGSNNQKYVFHTPQYSSEELENVPIAEVHFESATISITGINTEIIKQWFSNGHR